MAFLFTLIFGTIVWEKKLFEALERVHPSCYKFFREHVNIGNLMYYEGRLKLKKCSSFLLCFPYVVHFIAIPPDCCEIA